MYQLRGESELIIPLQVAVIDAIGNLNNLDDRKMLLVCALLVPDVAIHAKASFSLQEHALTFLSTKMPAGSLRTKLENNIIEMRKSMLVCATTSLLLMSFVNLSL